MVDESKNFISLGKDNLRCNRIIAVICYYLNVGSRYSRVRVFPHILIALWAMIGWGHPFKPTGIASIHLILPEAYYIRE